MDRFFTEDYLNLFLDDLISGYLRPSLMSEKVQDIQEAVRDGNSNSDGFREHDKEKGREEVGVSPVPYVPVVGSNFNAR